MLLSCPAKLKTKMFISQHILKIEKTTKFVIIGKCISKLRQKMLKRSRPRNGKQIA
jgi:hypothetical protein